MREYLFNTAKLGYVKGAKPDVECILCAIRDRNPQVKNLELIREGGFIVSVNLYPYNPGHLMIFPERHVTSPEEYTVQEAATLHELTVRVKRAIDAEFRPHGYNIGYNIGRGSGASISHLHLHVVPRYENEAGFIDILAGTRLIVVDPVEAMERLKTHLSSEVQASR